jgi:hypothetical protein
MKFCDKCGVELKAKEDVVKKFVFKCFLVMFIIVLAATFVSCGNDPKALAKQTIELMDDPLKNAGKLTEINAKVQKMSPKDQGIYTQEVMRLSGIGDLLGDLLD